MSKRPLITLSHEEYTITLPTPEFGDTITMTNNIIMKRDYNNKIHTIRRGPINKGLRFLFIEIPMYKYYELCAFIREVGGREIIYTDMSEAQHKVYCINNEVRLTKYAGHKCGKDKHEEYCNFELELMIRAS